MNRKKHICLLGAGVVIALVSGVFLCSPKPPVAHAAANSNLYLSPASQSLQTGSNLTLSIMVNTGGQSTNAIQTTITYPANIFTYVSITPDPVFSVFQPSTASGSVNFGAGAITPVSGVHKVATLVLHAANAGHPSVALSAICQGTSGSTCSAVVDATAPNQNDLGSIAGGSFTVSAPAPAATPVPTPVPVRATPKPTSKATASKTPTPAPAKASPTPAKATSSPTPIPATSSGPGAPKITGVTVSNITGSSATISWQTDISATSVVKYGLSQTLNFVASGTPGTSHEVKLGAPLITKGATYYYTVSSTSAKGATSTSESGDFTTAGFDVTIIVKDQNSKAIKGASVTLAGKTVKTDSGGKAAFRDVPGGKLPVIIKTGGKETKQTVQVGKDQTFTLSAQRTSAGSWTAVVVILVVVIGLLIVSFGLRFRVGSAGPAGVDPVLVSRQFPAAPSVPSPSLPAVPPNPVGPAAEPGKIYQPEEKQ